MIAWKKFWCVKVLQVHEYFSFLTLDNSFINRKTCNDNIPLLLTNWIIFREAIQEKYSEGLLKHFNSFTFIFEYLNNVKYGHSMFYIFYQSSTSCYYYDYSLHLFCKKNTLFAYVKGKNWKVELKSICWTTKLSIMFLISNH